jgi:hypothetical protein
MAYKLKIWQEGQDPFYHRLTNSKDRLFETVDEALDTASTYGERVWFKVEPYNPNKSDKDQRDGLYWAAYTLLDAYGLGCSEHMIKALMSGLRKEVAKR